MRMILGFMFPLILTVVTCGIAVKFVDVDLHEDHDRQVANSGSCQQSDLVFIVTLVTLLLTVLVSGIIETTPGR